MADTRKPWEIPIEYVDSPEPPRPQRAAQEAPKRGPRREPLPDPEFPLSDMDGPKGGEELRLVYRKGDPDRVLDLKDSEYE